MYVDHMHSLHNHMRFFAHTILVQYMMTSSNGNVFRVTGLLCGELIHRSSGIPLKKPSDAGLWYLFLSAPEPTIKQTMETPVIR